MVAILFRGGQGARRIPVRGGSRLADDAVAPGPSKIDVTMVRAPLPATYVRRSRLAVAASVRMQGRLSWSQVRKGTLSGSCGFSWRIREICTIRSGWKVAMCWVKGFSSE